MVERLRVRSLLSPVTAGAWYTFSMTRPQSNLKTLLWLMAVAAAFLIGADWNRRFREPVTHRGPRMDGGAASLDTLKMPDGTTWFRVFFNGVSQERLTFRGDNGETITITPPPEAE
jgi:hypothetical protein